MFDSTNEVISSAGGLPIKEHVRRQGQTLRWLLERCGNRYQVLSNQPGASEAQVAELFQKIQKMIEANKRPRGVQDRMYTQLRREVSLREVRRSQGRQEDIEMRVMHDMHDGRPWQRKQMASKQLQLIPRGKPGSAFSFQFVDIWVKCFFTLTFCYLLFKSSLCITTKSVKNNIHLFKHDSEINQVINDNCIGYSVCYKIGWLICKKHCIHRCVKVRSYLLQETRGGTSF